MKKILAICLLFLFVGLAFSASDKGDRELRTMDDADSMMDNSAMTDDSMRDSDSDTMMDDGMMEDETRAEDTRRDTTDKTTDRAMDRRKDNTEERQRKLDTLKEHRDRIFAYCESAEGDKAEACRKRLAVADKIKCDDVTNADAFNVCERSVRKAAENRCEDLEGEDKDLCLRKVEAYGKQYVARERHELNERCKGLNGTERAECEREINTEFKEHMRQRYLEWKNNTNTTMTDEEKQKIRERLLTEHREKVEELKNRTSEKKAKLLERLDHAIDQAERKVEKMETLIERISSKGHDVTELKYLLEEYQNSLDDARLFFDEEQYRDALASLKEAFRYFHEFKQTVRKILAEHREGRDYVESDEPFAVDESSEDSGQPDDESTMTENGETPDDDAPPEVVE